MNLVTAYDITVTLKGGSTILLRRCDSETCDFMFATVRASISGEPGGCHVLTVTDGASERHLLNIDQVAAISTKTTKGRK